MLREQLERAAQRTQHLRISLKEINKGHSQFKLLLLDADIAEQQLPPARLKAWNWSWKLSWWRKRAELFTFNLILSKFVFQMIKPSEEFQHPQSLWSKCKFQTQPNTGHHFGGSPSTPISYPGTGWERFWAGFTLWNL